MANKQRARVLYITYLGLLEPIPKSQVLPYLFGLSRDAKIHLLSFEKRWLLKKEPDQLKRLKKSLLESGITWHRLTYHKYPLVFSSLWDILLGIVISLFIIIRYKITILHARANIPIAIGYALKSFMPIKLLYDRRGIMGEEHLEYSGWKKGGDLYRFALWFEKRVINKCDSIVVLTNKANAQIKQNLNSGRNILIKTIPCCMDLELFNYTDNQNLKKELGLSHKFVLVYSGSLGTYNLLDEMFKFFAEALRLIPNAHFLILTQNKGTVFGLLKKKQYLDENKITITYSAQEKLPLFLSMADAGLIFRRISPAAMCASPIKFGEYLACGLPVISTPKIGDLEDIINSHKIGVVLEEHSETEYRKAIIRFLSLSEEKNKLKKRCREVAQDLYSLERGVNAYSDIYSRLKKN